MPVAIAAAITAGVAVIAINLAAAWCKRRTANLRMAGETLDRSYRAAQRLLKDADTPPIVVSFVDAFSALVGRPHLARSLVREVATGRWGKRQGTPRSRELKSALGHLSAERGKDFAEMVVFGLLTSASSDPFFASTARSAVEFAFLRQESHTVESPEKTWDVAADLAPKFERHKELATA